MSYTTYESFLDCNTIECQSILRATSSTESTVPSTPLQLPAFFLCPLCPASKPFKSEKALAQHSRIAHKKVSMISSYIDDTGICPACGVNLYARAKVVTHAAEARVRSKRSKLRCRDIILGGVCPVLPATVVATLNARDALLLRNARRQGHSHVQTARPAKRVASAVASRHAAAARLTRCDTEDFISTLHHGHVVVPNISQSSSVNNCIRCTKRIYTKSTVTQTRPTKRLRVKTTLPPVVTPGGHVAPVALAGMQRSPKDE